MKQQLQSIHSVWLRLRDDFDQLEFFTAARVYAYYLKRHFRIHENSFVSLATDVIAEITRCIAEKTMCAAVLVDVSDQSRVREYGYRVPCWPPLLIPHDQFLQVLYGDKGDTKIIAELAAKEVTRTIVVSSIEHAGELLLAVMDCLVSYLQRNLGLTLTKDIFVELYLRMNVLVNFMRWSGLRV